MLCEMLRGGCFTGSTKRRRMPPGMSPGEFVGPARHCDRDRNGNRDVSPPTGEAAAPEPDVERFFDTQSQPGPFLGSTALGIVH